MRKRRCRKNKPLLPERPPALISAVHPAIAAGLGKRYKNRIFIWMAEVYIRT
jgi:hypothetical protein